MKKFVFLAAGLMLAATAFSQDEIIKQAKKIASGETPDFEQAIQVINQATDGLGKNSADAWYTKGLIYSKQFDFEDEKRFLIPPQQPDVNLQSKAAYNAFKAWTVADSLDAVEAQNNPKRKGKLKYRGDIAKKVDGYKRYLLNQGVVLSQEGKGKEANKVFADVIALPKASFFADYDKLNANDSTFIWAADYYKLTLADYYREVLSSGDTIAAEKIIQNALTKYPEDPTFMTYALQHDIWAGRNQQAVNKLNKAIELNPNNGVLYLVRANFNGLSPVTREKAEPDYQKAMQLLPDNYNIIYAYGDYHKNLGDDAYNSANDLERKNPLQAKQLRDKFVSEYNTAITYIEKARSMKNPVDDNLLGNLQMIYAKLRSFYYSQKNDDLYKEFDAKMRAVKEARGY
ncbi:MAG: hypothetical protein II766_04355 [Paludibacteraceae bacterium]|jgi:Flp pilus assembly protein TadD|nr:hypothetical protein [Paludibacteraceae bacterium]